MRSRERLPKLRHIVTVLEQLPDRQWDFSTWGSMTENNACGTVCCALGACALDEKFQKQGLEHKWVSDGWQRLRMDISFGNQKAYSAGAVFFGLEQYEAEALFTIDAWHKGKYINYYHQKRAYEITKSDVIRAVKKLIRKYERKEKEAKRS